MCKLCWGSPDEKEEERARLRDESLRLRDLASRVEGLAKGAIEPHESRADLLGKFAVSVAHRLIKEWA